MTQLEETQPNLKKSSSLPRKWSDVRGLFIGFLLGLIVGIFTGCQWVVQLLPPTVKQTTEKEYPSWQECPKIEEEIDMQSVYWKKKSKKCIYKYKYKYQVKINEDHEKKADNDED